VNGKANVKQWGKLRQGYKKEKPSRIRQNTVHTYIADELTVSTETSTSEDEEGVSLFRLGGFVSKDG
jgi:hypothetical protein